MRYFWALTDVTRRLLGQMQGTKQLGSALRSVGWWKDASHDALP
jgi:hypothetical protein